MAQLEQAIDESDFVEEDSFKILLATDIHLGYAEDDPVKGGDSFDSFEEILKIAVKEQVDFILLGGDLFHECKPSTYCVQKCTELIKMYCFGDKPVHIEFLSDQSLHFQHLKNPVVNYEDPNLNVSIPIFSIHGNHDDPTGIKSMSPMDVLSTGGLINYFGKLLDLTKVELFPILLRKGESYLALYGLSHVPDHRLARLLQQDKVVLFKPDVHDFFNILVMHQNRVNRGIKNFIPETFIPGFVDMTVWGHEHDCLVEPVRLPNNKYVVQPGSSVATSLSEGESYPKHVFVLLVNKKQFMLRPIRLQTVRPFIFKTINLDDPNELKDQDPGINLQKHAEKQIADEVDKMIKAIEADLKAKKKKKVLPLIRIIVNYHSSDQEINTIRFSQKFIGRVANPENIVLQKKMLSERKKRDGRNARCVDDEEETDEDSVNLEPKAQVVFNFESEMDKSAKDFQLLYGPLAGAALTRFLEYSDANATRDMIDMYFKSTMKALKEMNAMDRTEVEAGIERIRKQHLEDAGRSEVRKVLEMFDDPNRTVHSTQVNDVSMDVSSPLPTTNDAPTPAATRGTRGRGRARAGTGRGRRGAKS